MYKKRIVVLVIMVFFYGCSQKENSVENIAQNEIRLDSINEGDSTMEEFVPEHIRRSHIEVVPHN